MLLHALVTGLWGGLLALERRAFLQAMFARPLVAGAGVGLFFDDVQTGLYVGLFFELLHLGGASLGGAHPDDELLPTVTAAALASSLGHVTGSRGTPADWALSILVCAPMGVLGRRVEAALDVRARRYLGRVRDALVTGNDRAALRQNLKAMWPHFAFAGLLCFLVGLAGNWLAPVLQLLPLGVLRGLAWAYPVLALVAASMAVAHAQARRRNVVAVVSALLGAGAAFFSGRVG